MATSRGLEEIVQEYHHLQAEHRCSGADGTGRRHLHTRLDEVEERFEHTLAQEVGDEGERNAWRARPHHGVEALPVASARPLAFRGRSSGGSVVEIRARADGDYDVEIDGAAVDRLGDGGIDVAVYEADGREFHEVFEAPAAALDALGAWVHDPSGAPPWKHLHELLRDGLVDRHFGLTARGRRALARA